MLAQLASLLVGMAPLSRRALLVTTSSAALLAPPRAANAFNINTFVTSLDKEALTRTPADFSQVVEIRPISGPQGVTNALVIVDAGNAGDFEYVWLKNAKTGKILGVANSAAPPPMVVKAQVPRV